MVSHVSFQDEITSLQTTVRYCTCTHCHTIFSSFEIRRDVTPDRIRDISKMATPEALFVKRKIFEDDDGRLRRDHAEGATIYSVAATVLVVRDQCISTVCSGCLRTKGPHSSTQLQHCSKCKFLNYCSRDCQVRS